MYDPVFHVLDFTSDLGVIVQWLYADTAENDGVNEFELALISIMVVLLYRVISSYVMLHLFGWRDAILQFFDVLIYKVSKFELLMFHEHYIYIIGIINKLS